MTEVEWRNLKILSRWAGAGKRERGGPFEDNRSVSAPLHPWRDVPEKYGNWNSIDLPERFRLC